MHTDGPGRGSRAGSGFGGIRPAARAVRRRRPLGNALIALGTLITGASGRLNSVGDEMTAFAITLVLDITVIFAGFLVVTAAPAEGASRPSRAAAR